MIYGLQMSSGMTHKYRYKNVGLDSQELRRRREEEGVQLRKQKREQQLSKRRNVPNVMDEDLNTTEAYNAPATNMVYLLNNILCRKVFVIFNINLFKVIWFVILKLKKLVKKTKKSQL